MLWLFFDIRGTPNCQVVRDHLFWWNRHMCHGQKTVFFLGVWSSHHQRCWLYKSLLMNWPSNLGLAAGVNPKHIRQLGSSSQVATFKKNCELRVVLKTTRTTHPQNGPKWVRSRACNRPTCHSPTSFASGPSTYHRPEPDRRGHHKIAISGRKSPENLARISEYQNLSIVSIILSLEMQNLSWLW